MLCSPPHTFIYGNVQLLSFQFHYQWNGRAGVLLLSHSKCFSHLPIRNCILTLVLSTLSYRVQEHVHLEANIIRILIEFQHFYARGGPTASDM